MSDAKNVVVFDFETTGLSPRMGDRPIEIGAVRLENGVLVDRFQALMNPGMKVNSFIENFTGINNKMLIDADSCEIVMRRFCDFIGDANLVAHNASFDKAFLDAELDKLSITYSGEVTCSMLLARRILSHSPNHKLGTLVDHLDIATTGEFHRALYDAEMTAKVWVAILETIQTQYKISNIPFNLIQKLTKTPIKSVPRLLTNY